MSNFIELADYDASIHREILDSLLRRTMAGGQESPLYNPQVVEICEDRAIAEVRSYLSAVYDCEAIFSARGADRHQLILMFTLDIAIYHIFCQHNPYKISDIRKERYDSAIDWLKQVSRRGLTIEGAPRLDKELDKANSPWQIEADTIRPTIL